MSQKEEVIVRTRRKQTEKNKRKGEERNVIFKEVPSFTEKVKT